MQRRGRIAGEGDIQRIVERRPRIQTVRFRRQHHVPRIVAKCVHNLNTTRLFPAEVKAAVQMEDGFGPRHVLAIRRNGKGKANDGRLFLYKVSKIFSILPLKPWHL